jgi:3-hydroxyisobutyrate dehydrogenase-like beta-hydroxyacid dehydrogenase
MGSNRQEKVVGFIGFGEAASEIALGLRDEGFTRLEAYDVNQAREPQGALVRNRASQAGISLSKDCGDLIKRADILVSATSSTVATSVAQDAAKYLSPGQLFADINSASPTTMEAASRAIAGTGAKFVDIAVMGPVPRSRHKVPMLASGEGAQEFADAMTPWGMNVRVIGSKPGQASAAKLVRSVYMKGAAALLYEMCLAADRYGVVDLVMASVCEDMDAVPFEEMATRFIAGTAIHAGRRVHEMEDVLQMLDDLGTRSSMSAATTETLRWISSLGLKEALGGKAPSEYATVLKAMRESPHERS